MRAMGLILVILGALGLGLTELGGSGKKREVVSERVSPNVAERTQNAIPPVYSGIALTSGLILVASGLKRS
jgi:hypothetical protein